MVKVMDYDSFGNVLSDSNPGLFLPLAFAGGLRDRFTGLVRFCHRDYDPTGGRFTAPDPPGDTGGDHDLYEYCVDDPVNAVDPEGLKEKAATEREEEPDKTADDQGKAESPWTNSTEGEGQPKVVYTESAGKPVTGEMADIAQCIANSAGQDITVSGAWETGHAEGSAHGTNSAIDVSKGKTPGFNREKAEEAYERCMPKDRGYAQEEKNHFHFQNRRGRGGATGFPAGVK